MGFQSVRSIVIVGLFFVATSRSVASAPVDQPAAPSATPASQPGDAPKPDASKPDAPRTGEPGRPQPGEGGERRRGEGQPGGGGQGGMPVSVKQSMSVMNRAVRTLKRQVGDATKKDENLKLIGDMQRGCLAAKGLSPERVLGRIRDETKREETAATYRKRLIELMGKLLALESAVLDGKTDDATALMKDIGEFRDESHKMLGVRE